MPAAGAAQDEIDPIESLRASALIEVGSPSVRPGALVLAVLGAVLLVAGALRFGGGAVHDQAVPLADVQSTVSTPVPSSGTAPTSTSTSTSASSPAVRTAVVVAGSVLTLDGRRYRVGPGRRRAAGRGLGLRRLRHPGSAPPGDERGVRLPALGRRRPALGGARAARAGRGGAGQRDDGRRLPHPGGAHGGGRAGAGDRGGAIVTALRLRMGAVAALAALTLGALGRAGSGVLAAPSTATWGAVASWYDQVGAATATLALVRLVAMAGVAWLAVGATLQLLASLSLSRSLAGLADALSPLVLRRLAHGAASLSVTAGLSLPAAVAVGAVPAGDPPGTAVMEVLDEPPPREPAAGARAGAPRRLARGQSGRRRGDRRAWRLLLVAGRRGRGRRAWWRPHRPAGGGLLAAPDRRQPRPAGRPGQPRPPPSRPGARAAGGRGLGLIPPPTS